ASNSTQTTVNIQFPAGAVTESMTLNVNVSQATQVAGQMSAIGNALTINAYRPDGTPITQFSKPFTITITVDPKTLGGVDFASFKIYYFSTTKGEWVAIPTVTNLATYTLVGTVDHLTTFAALGSKFI